MLTIWGIMGLYPLRATPMSEYSVHLDRNRHAYLQYRDAGKTRHFIILHQGSVECIQLTAKDFLRLRPYDKHGPEHFAQVCLNSHLPVARSARVILRGLLGQSEAADGSSERASFSGSSVSLEEICELNHWEPQKCRKFLRKLVEKPGGRWAWSPEEAEKVTLMLKECFVDG